MKIEVEPMPLARLQVSLLIVEYKTIQGHWPHPPFDATLEALEDAGWTAAHFHNEFC